MRKIFLTMTICAAALLTVELVLNHSLFRHVSYSNSESIDQQIAERNKRDSWNIIFVGDSEVRWGVNPSEIDRAFLEKGIRVESFNHAFDGFGAMWWSRIIPPLLKDPSLRNVEVVAVGIQMITSHQLAKPSIEDCGALQKPVLTSPFAVDLKLDVLCDSRNWDARLGREMFSGLWIVRYSSAVRALLLPQFMQSTSKLKLNSSKDGESYRGFEPHKSIAQQMDVYPQEFARWKAQYRPQRDFVPLQPTLWPTMVGSGGFFDKLNRVVTKSGRKLVLFALPTNPVVIDIFNRRQDYLRNSALLKDWAEKRGVIFIDNGIQDVERPELYFSDMRHLSAAGAKTYSKHLGDSLVSKMMNYKSNTLNFVRHKAGAGGRDAAVE